MIASVPKALGEAVRFGYGVKRMTSCHELHSFVWRVNSMTHFSIFLSLLYVYDCDHHLL